MAQKQYKFSLSIHDKHNRQVKKIVDGLLAKGNGALSQSIRDGLRLLNDLRRGNTRILLEMFPDIIEKLCPPEPPPTDDINDLKRLIEQMRQEMHQQRQIGIPEPAYKQSGVGVGTLAGQGSTIGTDRVMELPIFDDEDMPQMTVKLAPLTGPTNGANLQNSLLSLMAD